MKWKLSPIASQQHLYECGVCNSAKEVVFMMKMMVVGWWCQPNYNKWARLLTTVSVSNKKELVLAEIKTYNPPVSPVTTVLSRPVQHRVLSTNDRAASLQGCQRLNPLVLRVARSRIFKMRKNRSKIKHFVYEWNIPILNNTVFDGYFGLWLHVICERSGVGIM